jgi:hypothetical protein
MPWNIIILHLVAGYYISTRSYYFKFKHQRLDRQRLIFESVLLGVFISSITVILKFICLKIMPETVNSVGSILPYKYPFFRTSIMTLVIAISITELSNLCIDKNKAIEKAIKNVGNEIELIFLNSFILRTMVLISLKSDKVYIGWVKELPIPSISNHIRIIPAISGYRNDFKEVEFTTHYLSVYADFVNNGHVNRVQDLNFDVVINLSEVVSVGNFDLEMYQKFNDSNKELPNSPDQ